jgi:hypothetical protein
MTTTKTSTSARYADQAGLPALAQRFRTWRGSRQRGERIPEALWQSAMELARIHGLNPTVAALKLNYYDLQRRLQAGDAPRRGRARAPVFVEVPAVALPPGGAEQGTVELIQGCGTRLVLRFADASPRDLLPLVQLFLRHRA